MSSTGKRHRATAREAAPPTKKSKQETEATTATTKKKTVEETTYEQQKVVSDILGFKVMHNYPTGKAFGYSSYSCTELPHVGFPVLTRDPEAAGVLPAKLPSGDLGYFLGASDPADIHGAIVEAYIETHPGCNTKTSPWRNWKIYLVNRAYYGTQAFEKSGHQDISDLKITITQSKQWGGTVHRLYNPIARIANQKKYRSAVVLADYFKDKPPFEGAVFYTRDELSEMTRRYNEKLQQTTEIKKTELEKKISKIGESSDDSEEEEELSENE